MWKRVEESVSCVHDRRVLTKEEAELDVTAMMLFNVLKITGQFGRDLKLAHLRESRG